MTNPTRQPSARQVRQVIVGVDTHKHVHVAVALTDLGAILGQLTIPADHGGYTQLAQWATTHGRVVAFGVEGTGSYGAGLASYLHRCGHRVIEVNRPDRRVRRQRGKTDPIDAENAARAVLAGTATATPKHADGAAEMLRQLKIARDTAVKARTQAMITLKALVVTAPAELREPLDGLSKMALIDRCTRLRPGPVTTPTAAAKHALRALARRWLALTEEIKTHDELLETLTTRHAPQLLAQFGIGADTAAELLVLAGDNPERIRSEAAFAKLCGACPVPASSGKTIRYRLNRGGHRQANAALYRVVIVRMRFHQPTIDYVARRTAEGKTKAEIIRCLKRFLARQLYHLIRPPEDPATPSAA
jgi:transposase